MKRAKFLITNKPRLLIQPVNGNPFIGSGKVRRRIRVVNPTGSKKWARKTRGKKLKDLQPPSDSVQFYTSSVKRAFNHWCNLGYPMIKHVVGPSKTFSASCKLLKKSLEKNSLQEITTAMTLAQKVFNAEWFIFKRYFSRNKITLPVFINYLERHKRILPEKMREVDSWLEEFLKGEKYIRSKYSRILKDKHPIITDQLAHVWLRYIREDELPIDDRNNLVIFSKNAVRFAKKNNSIEALDIVYLLDQMLNKWDDRYKPKHAGWLNTSIFWEDKITKALVKNGTFESYRDINLI